MAKKSRRVEIDLDYQNYIETPPVKTSQMYGTACGSDSVTVDTWKKIWIDNIRANKQRFGNFKDHSVGKLWGINKNRPAIVVGSGPSLGYNGHQLKDRGEILAVSCLHNYHFFEDQGIDIDYYVTLDAGPVVIDEVSEGGKKTPEEYWASTKGKKLIAFIGTNPKLFELWQGEVYLYNAPVPEQNYLEVVAAMEEFNLYVGSGGNVLGACMYIAKGIMGSNPITYVGADFCFSYGKKFHAWDSKYDANLGYVLKVVDVFGNKAITWQSYFQFKNWFDYIALTVPGIWINCTEGGTLGAYPEGNIMAIKQMALSDFIEMYALHNSIQSNCENPEIQDKRLLF